MQEPGLEVHEWVSRWESLEPDLEDAPAETLPELARLVEEMLGTGGYEEVLDPDLVRDLEEAREIAGRLDAAETVDPGDVGRAAVAYRTAYNQLIDELRPD